MKYAILKKIFLFFACMGFLLLHQAEAVQIELTPAVTGSQARDCTIDPQDFPPVSCGNPFVLSDFFAARLSCGKSSPPTNATLYAGIIEFDISGAYGLFTSGQIQATPHLTISNFSYYDYDFLCVSVVNMKDARSFLSFQFIQTQKIVGSRRQYFCGSGAERFYQGRGGYRFHRQSHN